MARLFMTYGRRGTASLLAVLILFIPLLTAAIDGPVGISEGDFGALSQGAVPGAAPGATPGTSATSPDGLGGAVTGSVVGGVIDGFTGNTAPTSPAVNAGRGASAVALFGGLALGAAGPIGLGIGVVIGIAVAVANFFGFDMSGIPGLANLGEAVTAVGRAIGNFFSGIFGFGKGEEGKGEEGITPGIGIIADDDSDVTPQGLEFGETTPHGTIPAGPEATTPADTTTTPGSGDTGSTPGATDGGLGEGGAGGVGDE